MTDAVVFARRGRLGHIELNRPDAINALTHDMALAITAQLQRWADDAAVSTVLMTGSGDRGLCAGGDVIALREDALAGDIASAASFWRDEYKLDAYIARYPKPFVAVMDGLVLGGGVGLSAHSSHRVVTERTSLGLPEVAIGFVPDVGSTWLLSRAPGELGTHLALTAGRADAADALHLGLADHFVRSDQLQELAVALESETPHDALERFSSPVGNSSLASEAAWIDRAYASDDIDVVLEELDATRDASAADAVQRIRRHSPTSTAVTLASLRRARRAPSLEAALEQELIVSTNAFSGRDFAEGVRALLVDKDRDPRWMAPPTRNQVAAFFNPPANHQPLFSTARGSVR